ncbi:hypothetical protein B0H16DRAFT_1526609 [Mycena metata]|uniref:Secreted protein n=1 Tax=Mycena metata TaxID=1033252 RepID=A0AAD7JI07_9AGAR|nr:hypothetical protein B0H16DRAFT_1526609 [Mycena metata]
MRRSIPPHPPSDIQSFFLLLAAALGAGAAVARHAPLIINTPCAVRSCFASLPAPLNPPAAQCEPLLITWSGGIRAVQTNPIQPLPIASTGPVPVTDTSFTWVVNATLGQSLVLLVTDEENGSLHTVSSAPFTVIPGAGDGCINGN